MNNETLNAGLRLYFTAAQAAETLSVNEWEIVRAIEDGELRIYDFQNDEPRISRQTLEAWSRKQQDVVRVRH